MRYRDRRAAGRRLADELTHLRSADVIVLGLPRGGVPVAFEVACALDAPLDVIVVRKIGAPRQPELALGAVGEGGVTVLDEEIVRVTGVDPRDLDAARTRARVELERQAAELRGDRPGVRLAGRTAVVVDDGIATGSTVRAACRVVRAAGAARTVVAVPVGPPGTVGALAAVADEVVCPVRPGRFAAVGRHYDDFSPTSDAEVVALLAAATTPS